MLDEESIEGLKVEELKYPCELLVCMEISNVKTEFMLFFLCTQVCGILFDFYLQYMNFCIAKADKSLRPS